MNNYRLRKSLSASSKQDGVSLWTLLIAIAIIGLLAGIAVTQYNGSNSKGTAMYALMSRLGQSAQRFNVSTGCFPTTASALLSRTNASNNNSCNVNITADAWDGPYVSQTATDANNAFKEPNFGPSVTINAVTGNGLNANMAAAGTQYGFQAKNVPTAIADKALSACGGNGSSCVEGGGGAGGGGGGAAGGGTTSFTYVYAVGG